MQTQGDGQGARRRVVSPWLPFPLPRSRVFRDNNGWPAVLFPFLLPLPPPGTTMMPPIRSQEQKRHGDGGQHPGPDRDARLHRRRQARLHVPGTPLRRASVGRFAGVLGVPALPAVGGGVRAGGDGAPDERLVRLHAAGESQRRRRGLAPVPLRLAGGYGRDFMCVHALLVC